MKIFIEILFFFDRKFISVFYTDLMRKEGNNFAFIDGQNLYAELKRQGLSIDFKKFRVSLSEKYSVKRAYIFLGYIESNEKF